MLFFFYGTLIPGKAKPAVTAALRVLRPATIAGILHAIPDPDGWYPALLPGAGPREGPSEGPSEGIVHGRLCEAQPAFGAEDLARLDAYEDFDQADPAGSLYRRMAVVTHDGTEAQAYRFNQPLPAGARPIPEGDFWAWLSDNGLTAFGERTP